MHQTVRRPPGYYQRMMARKPDHWAECRRKPAGTLGAYEGLRSYLRPWRAVIATAAAPESGAHPRGGVVASREVGWKPVSYLSRG